MKKMKIELIGFDVDGVLLDTLTRSYHADCIVISKYGGKLDNIDIYREALGSIDSGDSDWSNFYQQFGIDNSIADKVEDEYYVWFNKNPANEIILGVEETLKRLYQPKFIVSKQKNLDNLLYRLDVAKLLKYFNISAIHAVRGSKTENIIYETSSRGLSSENVIYVGDSVTDIKYANESKVNSIAIANQYSYCTSEQLFKANPSIILEDIRKLSKVI
jgi:phosphoglycolate phosphatase-like HAD superfamily hydrolase